MQIERIDSYNFRIYLTCDELKTMDISADTFYYGTQAYRKLMAHIIRELETYHDFSHEDRPLRSVVTPLSGGDLYISIEAFDEADEVDPRFSTFAISMFDALHMGDIAEGDDEDDGEADAEPDEEETDVLEPPAQEDIRPDPNLFFKGRNPSSRLAFEKFKGSEAIIIFASYEDMMQAIHSINIERFIPLKSSLYMNIEDKRMYLLFRFPSDIRDYTKDFALLNDYGRFAPSTSTIRASVAEHCQCIFPARAFEKLA